MKHIERIYEGGLLAREVLYALGEPPQQEAVGTIVKSVDEDRYLLTVAYPADKLDANVAMDQHRDFAGAEVVEKAAWRFMQKGAKLGMWHQDGYDHCAEVVESYIYRNPVPWEVPAADGTVQTVCKGDWLLGTILEPPTWALFKAGLIGGMSPQGRATRAAVSQERLAELRSN